MITLGIPKQTYIDTVMSIRTRREIIQKYVWHSEKFLGNVVVN